MQELFGSMLGQTDLCPTAKNPHTVWKTVSYSSHVSDERAFWKYLIPVSYKSYKRQYFINDINTSDARAVWQHVGPDRSLGNPHRHREDRPRVRQGQVSAGDGVRHHSQHSGGHGSA